ncbi:MAG TPA: GntR family transcriptional regulator [Gemmatimonas sp.]|nr:GntR family transcriptional regulator [Gemmatimonas sp.]
MYCHPGIHQMPSSRRTEIAETLRQRVLNATHLHGLSSGARLPSARTLAKELDADPRVVAAAYRALASEGVVQRRPPSRGFFVATDGAVAPAPTVEWMVEVFVAGLTRGIHAPDLPEHVRRAMEGARLRAACIECNADQQVWLCRELEEDYGITGTAIDVASLRDDAPPVAMRHADLVVTTRSHEADVRAMAAQLGKPLVVVAVRSDLTARVHRLLATTPVYFVGTDPRFGEKIARHYADAESGRNARPIIVGRDDVNAIPRGGHAWVMRTARDAIGGVPEHLQVLSTLRAFAVETQRALLRFVVQANLAAHMHRPLFAGSPGAP